MCGIAGSYRENDTEVVRAMLSVLRHRGPDGTGLCDLPGATFGHSRLAILDLQGGHQPMEAGGTWITYNGEVYNYRILQERFLGGAVMSGHSDTEVLLHFFRKLGPSMIAQLDGMFALAILHEGELFLARDPLGIKPLYYGEKKGVLYFASEIKALSRATDQIREFPAGHWYHSRLGLQRYYDVAQSLAPFSGGKRAAHAAIRETLDEAVRKRLLADVPVGISLSGGLDSSIVALLANRHTQHLHSFVVGMEGSEDIATARRMADLLGTRHFERTYTEADMIDALPKVIFHLESFDPALVRSAIPNHFLAETASRHVKVILTGEGADEIYGGYDYMSDLPDEVLLQTEMLTTTVTLHNTNLQRADRVPMAFGLEARVPFLDTKSVSLALGFPASWKLHGKWTPKKLLRDAFREDLPPEIVNRPKQKFSKGAGSSDVLASLAERLISDDELNREHERLLKDWNYALPNKEALYYYRILRKNFQDQWILPTMGRSRSL
jgi:asparagine synthase (glutamine-hydrolysing)